jgi:hypothetical protein
MMRAVSYVTCRLCGKYVEVYFAHGAIQVYPCRECCSFRGIIKRLIMKIWSR